MIKLLDHGYFNDSLKKVLCGIPNEYKVDIKVSKHFVDRIRARTSVSMFSTMLDVLECVKYNYPLILYYAKLDTALPERGRLESDDYVICGDIINDAFILRTFYEK